MASRRRTRSILPLIAAASLAAFGCSDEPVDLQARVRALMSDPSAGLVDQRKVGDLTLTLRMLPSIYLQPEVPAANGANPRAATFLLSVATDQDGTSTQLHGIESVADLDERMRLLAFDALRYFTLRVGSIEMAPVLCNVEPDYGIRPDLRLSIVFPMDSDTLFAMTDVVRVTFVDPTFDTGVHEFTFNPGDFGKNLYGTIRR